MRELLRWAVANPGEVVALATALAALVEALRRAFKQVGQDHALKSVVQAIEAVNSKEVKKAVKTISESKGVRIIGRRGLAELQKAIDGLERIKK